MSSLSILRICGNNNVYDAKRDCEWLSIPVYVNAIFTLITFNNDNSSHSTTTLYP